MTTDKLANELQIVLQEHLKTRRYLRDGDVIAALTILLARALYRCTETEQQAHTGPQAVVTLLISEFQRLYLEDMHRESAN